MELWIRSQNKHNLIKINELYISNDDYEETGQVWANNKTIIGVYDTKERALEVLDEIEEIINNGIQETKYDTVGNENYKIKTDRKVYKMPKE